MKTYKAELPQFLSQSSFTALEPSWKDFVEKLSAKELAHLFVDAAFLTTAMKFVEESHWLESKNSPNEISFNRFIKKFFKQELTPILFLHAFLEGSSLMGITQAGKNAEVIEQFVVNHIKAKPYADQKIFAVVTLQLMSELFEFTHQLALKKKDDDLYMSLSLYRTFDILDQIFELKYILNEDALSTKTERLYAGAGLGVQSSYATMLTALRYLNPAKGSRFIDLGSGYGRVGLVVGLMRPDIDFIGYEFVEDRVNIANHASANLALNQHVRFHTQDLSEKSFKIPIADTYYIFDSFTDESYLYILEQLEAIALQKKITVVTKGNARLWLKKVNWAQPQEFDGGNLCFFRSR